MKNIFFIISFALVGVSTLYAQELKVVQSEDKQKVNIDVHNGVSTIAFETSIKNLLIDDDFGDECIRTKDGTTLYLIQPRSKTDVNEYGHPRRVFLLKTPKTPEYLLDIPEIRPNTVLYYTVVISNQFPLSLTAEYLSTESSKYGIRVSFGKQFGGYLSYKWGEFRPSGKNINTVQTDIDLTQAENLGYIQRSITGGARFGILHRNIAKSNNGLYLLIGGGYGEYGRQWKNPTQVEGNIYFYTDYMKGFDGELALQVMAFDWLTASIGADMLVAKGEVSVDYMIGLGINLNFSKFKKRL